MGDPLDNIHQHQKWNLQRPWARKPLHQMEFGGGSEGGGEDWLASKPVVAITENNMKCVGGLLIYYFLKATGQIKQICKNIYS